MASIYDKASLVLIPSGTKTSKVYSQVPTNGDGDFTFSRSTAATRVNASGNIEKETQNLLLQSNNFSSSWTASSASVTGGQTGYDGSSDAWLLSKSAANGRVFQNIASSGVQTFSVYAKAAVNDWAFLLVNGGSNPSAWFDLSTGSLGSTTGGVISHNISDVGNGWYKISISFNETISRVRIYVGDANGDNSGTSGSIYIQDAQLEQGLVARDYIETTTTAIYGGITDNVPRLDYTDSSCPALLLEPQRTNVFIQSEYFGGYSNSNSTDTANDAESPEGVNNATSFKEAATTGQHKLFTSVTFDGSSTYTFSIFAKHNGRDLYVDTQNSNEWGGRAWFDLTAGTANAILGTADIEDFGNGWYRCIVTGASTLAGGNFIELLTSDGSTNSTTGDVTKGVYIYGAQLEAGTYATSYIPTYGSAVTRNEDRPFNVSLPIYDNDQASIYYEVSYDDVSSVATNWVSLQIDVATNDWFFFGKNGDDNLRMYLKANNAVISSQILDNVLSANQTHKMLFRYSSTKASLYLDGTEVITYNQAITTPSFNRLSICNSAGTGATTSINMKKLMVFPTALTDQEAIDLTTI